MNPKFTYLIIYFILCIPFLSHGEKILDVRSVKIAENYPAEFLFDLEEDDNFQLTYKIIEGVESQSGLRVYLIDLNLIEEVQIMQFKQRFGSIRIPSTGKYKLVFEYEGKGRFSWKGSKSISLNFTVESSLTQVLESGESRQILQISNLPIDDNVEESFKLVYNLSEGDKLYINSGDPKASFVKVYIQQLGLKKFVNSLGTINIESSGKYTFEFYLEENKEVSGIYQTLASLLSKDDVNFSDLVITVEKAVKADISFSQQVGGSMYGTNNSRNGTNATEEDSKEIDPNAHIKSLMEQMKNNSANSSESQLAYMQLMQEQLRILEENSRVKERVEITPTPRAPINFELSPSNNFYLIDNNISPNRKCELLNLKGGGLYNIWFYWIGVGERAEEAFDKSKEKFASYNQKNIIQEKAEYYYYSNSGEAELAGTNPPLPTETDPAYAEFLNEDVEYAIVDYPNTKLFLQGERYQNLSISNFKYVTADEGISFLPSSADQEYYICTCNNNKNTPIEVFFTYFTISTTTLSY